MLLSVELWPEDIVLGRGSVWDCTFKLRERLESLAQEIKDLAR